MGVALKEKHALVRSGPYALVRHPIYSGILLAVLGKALGQGKLAGALAFAILLLEWERKSRIEERLIDPEPAHAAAEAAQTQLLYDAADGGPRHHFDLPGRRCVTFLSIHAKPAMPVARAYRLGLHHLEQRCIDRE